jgi:hypothetical protein
MNAILPGRPECQREAARAAALLEQVRGIFRAFHPTENEAQSEHELIRPAPCRHCGPATSSRPRRCNSARAKRTRWFGG